MTLMDAPKFDAARSRHREQIFYGAFGGLLALFILAWIAVGHPIDGPWTWWTYWQGNRVTEQFYKAVETNDLTHAYAIWTHDPNWQQHPRNYSYNFDRFQQDWSKGSPDNDYGVISSHEIVVKKYWGGVLVTGSMINGRKSKPLFLAYDPKLHTLGFSPVQLSIN